MHYNITSKQLAEEVKSILMQEHSKNLNEATYEEREDGRLILTELTTDTNFDGQVDDPGLNNVFVELCLLSLVECQPHSSSFQEDLQNQLELLLP